MPSLKDLRKRIASVNSTRKITSAMKVVAGSKLKRAEVAATEGRPFAARMERMLGQLISSMPNVNVAPKLLAGSGDDKVQLIIPITGDRGLCGGFNMNVVRETRRLVHAHQNAGRDVKLICIGGKGRDGLRRDCRHLIMDSVENVTRNGAQFGPARDLAARLANMFEADEFDVCTLVYNRFKSAMSQVVTVKQLVPFPLPENDGAAEATQTGSTPKATYELEPNEDQLLMELLPANVSVQIFGALLESYASEQGARMTAMDNATRNAGDLIDRLTLTYNRSRQAAITKELIEIISGAEAV